MPASIASRVPPASRQKLLTPLAAASSAALRAIGANKLLQPVMAPETVSELVAAGYAQQAMGGIKLTDEGQVRAMMENGQ